MLNKIKGGLFGVAIGDALGVSVEFMSSEEIKSTHGKVTEIIGGGVFGFKKGEVSDDTEMTLCVAKGILKNPLFPLEDIGEEFMAWRNGFPKDIGNTVSMTFKFYDSVEDWGKAAEMAHHFVGGRSAGNGTLMRTLPVAFAYSNLKKMEDISVKQSKMTHFDDVASEACVLYNRIAYRLLSGEELTAVISDEIKGTQYEHVLTEKPTCVADGYVVHTMQWVLYTLLHTETFEEAVQYAVNLGHDTDTVGAITGGLAGVYYGYDALPIRYINELHIQDELEKISIDLYSLREK